MNCSEEYFRRLKAAREQDRADLKNGTDRASVYVVGGEEVRINVTAETDFFNKRLIEQAWGLPQFSEDDEV
jgi:hypothetical protein